MKKVVTESSEKQQFSTFLIKKSRDGKMGLWFVMVHVPSLGNYLTKIPVWRKIEDNGLPRDIGAHGPFILGGDIKLLGGDDSGPKEKEYISQVISLGSVPSTIPYGTSAFNDREQLFNFILSHLSGDSKRVI